MPASPMIEITYCRRCGWGLRAGWMAQELLTTFAEEVGSVVLTPDATGGMFEVRVGDDVIWSRKERGASPTSRRSNCSCETGSRPAAASGTRTAPERICAAHLSSGLTVEQGLLAIAAASPMVAARRS
jgi:selenoprotein W-related protein